MFPVESTGWGRQDGKSAGRTDTKAAGSIPAAPGGGAVGLSSCGVGSSPPSSDVVSEASEEVESPDELLPAVEDTCDVGLPSPRTVVGPTTAITVAVTVRTADRARTGQTHLRRRAACTGPLGIGAIHDGEPRSAGV